jgi:alpha-D-ribose 1-methylphosphonate 5-triphosphate diphosphatase
MPKDTSHAETILGNARMVLADEVVTGHLVIRDGHIAEIGTGALPAGAEDCEGDFLCAGLIELHTDNIERHITPRPKVAWPHHAAIVAHDAELAGCGISTVFDAIRVGSIVSNAGVGYRRYARSMADEILAMRAAGRPEDQPPPASQGRDLLRDAARGAGGVRRAGPGGYRQPDGPHARAAAIH